MNKKLLSSLVVAVAAFGSVGTASAQEVLTGDTRLEEVSLPFAAGRQRAWLHQHGLIEDETQGEDGYVLTVRWTPRQRAEFDAL